MYVSKKIRFYYRRKLRIHFLRVWSKRLLKLLNEEVDSNDS